MGSLPTDQPVTGFASHPEKPWIMYVVTRDRLFKSLDAGKIWLPIGQELEGLAAVAINPKWPDEVYVATAGGAIWKSTDRGETWEQQQ